MADAVYQSSPLLVFVHIPKTAGTTLRTILNVNVPGEHHLTLANVFKGAGGLSTGRMRSLREGTGPELEEGVMLVRGHFPLGIREYLPKYMPKQRELRCFTFLREPIDRILSHYFQVRQRIEDHRLEGRPAPRQGQPGFAEPPTAPTLDDALASGYIHDNLHTRMLCGDPEPFGEVTEEMLREARRNLREGLVFFGLAERFDESLVLAKRRLGLHDIVYRSSRRVNPARPEGDEIPADLRRGAERCNRYDSELYRYAQELFEEALEPRDLEFEVELAALRAAKCKPKGELEVETPAPASFDGDEEAWRTLVHTRATTARRDRELAETKVIEDKLSQRTRQWARSGAPGPRGASGTR